MKNLKKMNDEQLKKYLADVKAKAEKQQALRETLNIQSASKYDEADDKSAALELEMEAHIDRISETYNAKIDKATEHLYKEANKLTKEYDKISNEARQSWNMVELIEAEYKARQSCNCGCHKKAKKAKR